MSKPTKTTESVASFKRYIFINGTINEDTSKDFINSLLKLELENPTEDIVVIIDSYGGYVDEIWAITDSMNLCRCKIHTICTGKAMSAAACILMNGTNGLRYSTPNSRIMIHKLSGCHFGSYDNLDVQMKESVRLEKQLENFIISKTKFNKNTLKNALSNDYYMDAESARKHGIIDKIITSFSELKIKGW